MIRGSGGYATYDHLLGFTGPKAEAEEIKIRLAAFLREELKLELSQEKTLITHARTGAARFLGYEITVQHADHKVTGKGRAHTLPIPVDVGQALTAWLRLRPAALDRAVFVRMKAPRRMMTTSAISGIVARLSSVAGIDQIYAHRLRHTAAMDVLAAGGTLTEAKELLGHVHTATTMAYAKVDLASLRELVVPFGQVPR